MTPYTHSPKGTDTGKRHRQRPREARRPAPSDALLRELQALRRSEAVLRDFVETSTIGLHWVGADGTILWANQAELDLLGYTTGRVYRPEHRRVSRRRGCHQRHPRLPEPGRNPARPPGAAAASRRIDPPCPDQFERLVRRRKIRSHALLYPRCHRSPAGAGSTEARRIDAFARGSASTSSKAAVSTICFATASRRLRVSSALPWRVSGLGTRRKISWSSSERGPGYSSPLRSHSNSHGATHAILDQRRKR